ncbi:MAG: hypothetical protein HY362_00445 [Candidatus Aenigmarchaeota archaeon]|nr:hypothetical protein [Candidatus Aenigmarchaeota archaeon]
MAELKVEIKSDLLPIDEAKLIEYKGDHPSKMLGQIPDWIRETLRVTSSDFFEDVIKWDRAGPTLEFYGEWRGRFPKDRYSTYWLWIRLHGYQSAKDLTGTAHITIKGWLMTKMTFNSELEKMLRWPFLKYFYMDQRKVYEREGKERLLELESRFRSFLGLPATAEF